jgi:flagellar protein FlbD
MVFILLSRGPFSYLSFQAEPDPMIALTRLNGQRFVINAEKIKFVESTPDTLVCCDSGERLMVKETLQEVVQRAIEYSRAVRRPISD